jgi:hypothetical protein
MQLYHPIRTPANIVPVLIVCTTNNAAARAKCAAPALPPLHAPDRLPSTRTELPVLWVHTLLLTCSYLLEGANVAACACVIGVAR